MSMSSISAVRSTKAEQDILERTPVGTIEAAVPAHVIWIACNACNAVYNKETVKRRLGEMYDCGRVDRTEQRTAKGQMQYAYWRTS